MADLFDEFGVTPEEQQEPDLFEQFGITPSKPAAPVRPPQTPTSLFDQGVIGKRPPITTPGAPDIEEMLNRPAPAQPVATGPADVPTEEFLQEEAKRPGVKESLYDAATKISRQAPQRFKQAAAGFVQQLVETALRERPQIEALLSKRVKDLGGDRILPSKDEIQAVAAQAAEIAKEASDKAQALAPEKRESTAEQIALDTFSGLANMAPMYALGAAYGVPAVLGTLGVQSQGSKYAELRQAGVDDITASKTAFMTAAAEVIPETIPAVAILKKGSPLVRRLIDATFFEGASEALTSVLQQTIDKTQLEKMSLQEALKTINWGEAGYDWVIGSTLGFSLAAGAHPFVRDPEALAQAQEAAIQESKVQPSPRDALKLRAEKEAASEIVDSPPYEILELRCLKMRYAAER